MSELPLSYRARHARSAHPPTVPLGRPATASHLRWRTNRKEVDATCLVGVGGLQKPHHRHLPQTLLLRPVSSPLRPCTTSLCLCVSVPPCEPPSFAPSRHGRTLRHMANPTTLLSSPGGSVSHRGTEPQSSGPFESVAAWRPERVGAPTLLRPRQPLGRRRSLDSGIPAGRRQDGRSARPHHH